MQKPTHLFLWKKGVRFKKAKDIGLIPMIGFLINNNR
jgi:hypothetical protein